MTGFSRPKPKPLDSRLRHSGTTEWGRSSGPHSCLTTFDDHLTAPATAQQCLENNRFTIASLLFHAGNLPAVSQSFYKYILLHKIIKMTAIQTKAVIFDIFNLLI